MSEYIKKEDVMQAVQDHFDQGGFGSYQDGQDMMRRITALHGIEVVPCEERGKKMSNKIQETYDMIADLKKQLGYQGCRNCKNQIEPLRMCEWGEQNTEATVYIICPKWERKDTPSEN